MSRHVFVPDVRKSREAIIAEWDAVAGQRDREIESGDDISYHHVLMPAVLACAAGWAGKRVLDVGCGSGHLTRRIAGTSATTVGIDMSCRAIALARSRPGPGAVEYLIGPVEEYAAGGGRAAFDVVVANMVLQSVVDVVPFLRAVSQCLCPAGEAVCTLPHPCFWPNYWGYDRADWYDYAREQVIETALRTTRNPTGVGSITFVHRPLECYTAAFAQAGLRLAELKELLPGPGVAGLYPAPWKYPRFIRVILALDRPGEAWPPPARHTSGSSA